MKSHLDEEIFIRSARELHSYLFPDSRVSGISENSDFKHLVESAVSNIDLLVRDLAGIPHAVDDARKKLSKVDNNLSALRSPLGITCHNQKDLNMCDNRVVNAINPGIWDPFYDRIYFVLNAVDMVLDFEQEFESISSLKKHAAIIESIHGHTIKQVPDLTMPNLLDEWMRFIH